MRTLGWLAVILAACAPDLPIDEAPPEGVAERELIGVAKAVSSSVNDLTLDERWAAMGVSTGVRLWERDAATGLWAQGDLIATPSGSEGFGNHVSLDGHRLAVAAPLEDVDGVVNSGAVYLYEYDADEACGVSWCFEAKVTAATPEADGLFGLEDIDLDGDRLLVGARVEGATDIGAAYVFDRDPTGLVCGDPWCLTQRLVPDGTPASAWFGRFVDLDGDRLIVGAYSEGAAYVFDRDPTGLVCGGKAWCRTQRLVGSDTSGSDGYGIVALDGDRIAVGAALKSNTGAVYTYERTNGCGNPWCETAKIPNPEGGSGDSFGFAVDLEGTLLAVGRYGGDAGLTDAGDIRFLDWRDGAWVPVSTLVSPSPTASARFGMRLDLDGSQIGVLSLSGAAHLFGLMPRGPGLLVDPSLNVATVDGTFTTNEYQAWSLGINTGFADAAGASSRLYVDSGECGPLAFGFQKGPGNLNDQVVIYIDAVDGGFSTTAGFTDAGDGLRAAISGYDGTTRATLAFAPGFAADFAIAFDDSFAGMWELGNPHNFHTAFEVPDGAADAWIEMGGIRLSDLGLAPGDSFRYVVTYLNGPSGTFRSDEFHGVEPGSIPAGNPGTTPVILEDFDYLTFVSVQPVPPVARDDGASVAEGGTVGIDVLANDSEDGSGVAIVSGPAHGIAQVQGDGTIAYEHDGGEATTDTFTYRYQDACGAVGSVGTVTISITPVEDPPTLSVPDVVAEVDEDVPENLPAITVVDDDTETLTVRLAVSHGTLSIDPTGIVFDAGGNDSATMTFPLSPTAMDALLDAVEYTGAADYNGDDTLVIELDDDRDLTSPVSASLSIEVLPVNDPPVVDANTGFTVAEGATHVILAAELVGHDVDDGDADLRFVLTDLPDAGEIRADGAAIALDGSFTVQQVRDGLVSYAHGGGQGASDTFVVRLTDDDDAQAAPTTVSVTLTGVDDPPTAAADAYTIDEDDTLVVAAPGVLGNDADADGDALTAAVASVPAHGTLALAPDGSFTYTPIANYAGGDVFSYTATANGVTTSAASVALTVTAVNDAPLAVADAYDTEGLEELVVDAASGVLANDADAEGDGMTAAVATEPMNGLLALAADGSFTYTPDKDFFGTDTFEYTASDGTDASAATMVTVEVAELPVDTDDTSDTGDDDTGPRERRECSCAVADPTSLAPLLLAAALIGRRRRTVRRIVGPVRS